MNASERAWKRYVAWPGRRPRHGGDKAERTPTHTVWDAIGQVVRERASGGGSQVGKTESSGEQE